MARANFLLMPSEDEGFGLPIVEAARQGLPLLLRDIAVFREIAGAHATYFEGSAPEDLAQALLQTQALIASGQAPDVGTLRTLDWAQAARNFWQLLTQPS